jgi:hypothetical protein
MKTVSTAVLAILIGLTLACGYSAKMTAPVAGSMPAITQLAPDNTAAGASFLLTVNGANFNANAVLNFNGAAQATTFVSASQVTATIPATAVAAAGSASVSVTNPGTPGTGIYGTGATLPETSSAVTFTIN